VYLTVNTDRPWTEAMALEGNSIAFVGSTDDANDSVGPDTRVEDPGGRSQQARTQTPSPTQSWIATMERIRLSEKLTRIHECWEPKIVAELNGQHVKLAKVTGEFVWHHHANGDELFLVLHGRLTMEFRDRKVVLAPGDVLVVPRGVEHRPVAEEEAHILMFEPAGTLNTGNVRDERTREHLERL
jgi:mannose-6-phosphate isomerase-like protein (cupin superfamily)